MKQTLVSIAAWSVGSHAVKNTLPAIHETNNLFFKGIYTRNTDILQQQAKKYSVKAYNSIHEMLGDSELDAVYIASPVGIHYEQVKVALQANKHVIVEKSSFETWAQAEELIGLAKEKGLVLMEAFMYRFHEQFIKLLDLIQSGQFGQIRRIITTFGFPHLLADNVRYNSELGGGSLLDAGAYAISSIYQMLAKPNLSYSRLSVDDGFKVDTNGFAIFNGREDTMAVANWCFGADYKNEIEVWCEDATIVVKRAFSKPANLETMIEIYQNGILHSAIKIEPMNHFINMFHYFATCINDQTLKYNEHAVLLEQMKLIDFIRNNSPI